MLLGVRLCGINKLRHAGFDMDPILTVARNPQSGLGSGGHSCVDSSYNVYFIYVPSAKTA